MRSRCKLCSQATAISRRDAWAGPTLVTRNTSSRRPTNASPTSSSAAPLPYISPVSTRVMPRSKPSWSAVTSASQRSGSSPMPAVPCPSTGIDSPSGRSSLRMDVAVMGLRLRNPLLHPLRHRHVIAIDRQELVDERGDFGIGDPLASIRDPVDDHLVIVQYRPDEFAVERGPVEGAQFLERGLELRHCQKGDVRIDVGLCGEGPFARRTADSLHAPVLPGPLHLTLRLFGRRIQSHAATVREVQDLLVHPLVIADQAVGERGDGLGRVGSCLHHPGHVDLAKVGLVQEREDHRRPEGLLVVGRLSLRVRGESAPRWKNWNEERCQDEYGQSFRIHGVFLPHRVRTEGGARRRFRHGLEYVRWWSQTGDRSRLRPERNRLHRPRARWRHALTVLLLLGVAGLQYLP